MMGPCQLPGRRVGKGMASGDLNSQAVTEVLVIMIGLVCVIRFAKHVQYYTTNLTSAVPLRLDARL
jgi:hypothetical protein